MASLRSSCTANPSHHLIPNARWSHRFHVSCNGGADKNHSSAGRRNMLLGLGGLYSATNLISDPKAFAEPIQPLDANCCPPVFSTAVDYQLQPVTALRRRVAAHKLSETYISKFEEGIRKMKELDKTDPTDPRGFMQQANIHCTYCVCAREDEAGGGGMFPDLDLSIHFSWIFFPFHRWFLYFYERILGSLIDEPTFALPFWNWDNPPGMTMPMMFDDPNSPLYDPNRNQTHRPPTILNLALNEETNPLQIIPNNLSVMYNEMVGGVATATDFLGQPYKAGDPAPPPAYSGTLERGAHGSVHLWVGDPRNMNYEDMGTFYSAARDPTFFAHHANIDRMWAIWRNLKTDYPKDITDPDFLNTSFLFYDENKNLVRVKVADCVDYTKMGYDYEPIDTPWLDKKPTMRTPSAKIQEIGNRVPTVDEVFPTSLNKVVKILVSKPTKGKADEVLVVEDIQTDSTKFVKFHVFVNDEDDKPKEVDKAEYAGTFAQMPERVNFKTKKGSMRLSLKELYDNINVGNDDTVVVTIVPVMNGGDVTVGGVKIIPATG